MAGDDCSQWHTGNEHISEELRSSGNVKEVAIAADGPWVVIKGETKLPARELTKTSADQCHWETNCRCEIREAHLAAQREREKREAQEAAERQHAEQEAEERRHT